MSTTTDAAADQAGGATHPPLSADERLELRLRRIHSALAGAAATADHSLSLAQRVDDQQYATSIAIVSIAASLHGLVDALATAVDGVIAGDFDDA